MPTEKLGKPYCVRLPEFMDSWVNEKAKELGCSIPQAIRQAIATWILVETNTNKEEEANRISAQFTRALKELH